MPVNPYDPEEAKRRAQMGMLRQPPDSAHPRGMSGGFVDPMAIEAITKPDDPMARLRQQQPTSTTMPIGGAPKIIPQAAAAGPQAFEGFDFGREQNKGKSAKDSFAHYSKLAPTAPTNDKAALAQWFDQYVRPGMNADGHGAEAAQGDKFRFKNWQGEFDVDFGRGAGAEGGALAWQADPAGQAAHADAAAMGGGAPFAPIGMNPAMDDGALARIMAELDAAQNNDQSPAEREALLEMLQGGSL